MVYLSTFPGGPLGILGRGVPLSYPNPDPQTKKCQFTRFQT